MDYDIRFALSILAFAAVFVVYVVMQEREPPR